MLGMGWALGSSRLDFFCWKLHNSARKAISSKKIPRLTKPRACPIPNISQNKCQQCCCQCCQLCKNNHFLLFSSFIQNQIDKRILYQTIKSHTQTKFTGQAGLKDFIYSSYVQIYCLNKFRRSLCPDTDGKDYKEQGTMISFTVAYR